MSDSELKWKNKKSKLKIGYRLSLVKRRRQENCSKKLTFFNKNTLKKSLSYLLQQNRKTVSRSKQSCRLEGSTEDRIDEQIKLKCRQLPNIVHELRKTILRQDWDETAILLMILCHPGLKLYSSIILKSCFLLLFNHQNSNFLLLQNFIRKCTGYILEEDINAFIKILFSLRNSMPSSVESGKEVRSSIKYKITKDPEFEKYNVS